MHLVVWLQRIEIDCAKFASHGFVVQLNRPVLSMLFLLQECVVDITGLKCMVLSHFYGEQ